MNHSPISSRHLRTLGKTSSVTAKLGGYRHSSFSKQSDFNPLQLLKMQFNFELHCYPNNQKTNTSSRIPGLHIFFSRHFTIYIFITTCGLYIFDICRALSYLNIQIFNPAKCRLYLEVQLLQVQSCRRYSVMTSLSSRLGSICLQNCPFFSQFLFWIISKTILLVLIWCKYLYCDELAGVCTYHCHLLERVRKSQLCPRHYIANIKCRLNVSSCVRTLWFWTRQICFASWLLTNQKF